MKPERMLRHFLVAGVLALVAYGLLYYTIEHWRTRKGPWEVVFSITEGSPQLTIHQRSLGISNVQVRFAHVSATGESHKSIPDPKLAASPTHMVFRQPQKVPFALPFGRCVFMDSTTLPGSVAMEFFDHEIELLPRVLLVDRHERAWISGSTITLAIGAAGTEESPREVDRE